MERKAYVYIIGEPDSYHIKIGVACDVRRRCADLQIGNPRKLEILYTAICPNKEFARQVEYRAHIRFAECRRVGEWFWCPMDEARAVIDEAVPYVRNKRANIGDTSYRRHRDFGAMA